MSDQAMSDQAMAPRLGGVDRFHRVSIGAVAALIGLYLIGGVLGFAIFVSLFKLGTLEQFGVLFFRGLCLAGLTFCLTFLLLLVCLTRARPARGWLGGLNRRDAFSAAILSLSFNICFLVIVPVTVDRSISVFMLGEMAADPDRLYASDEMSRLFTAVYVGDYQQIDRRLREQSITGNVERMGDAYRITPRGRLFISFAKWNGWLFGGDKRFASPPAPSQ